MYIDVTSNTITLKPTSNWSANSKVQIKTDTSIQVHAQNKVILWAYIIIYFEASSSVKN
jgi:hypothetical protein